MLLARQLEKLLGKRQVSIKPATLAEHAGDKWFAAHPPEVVVFAESTDDVSKLLKFAHRRRIPVTPRGAGYGYVGGCVPLHGGIVPSVARMKKTREVNFGDAVAVVDPGVTPGDLQPGGRAKKLFYPPDPASLKDCSIGG